MGPLVMGALVQGLSEHRPLKREIRDIVGVHDAVDAPCRREMIQDHIAHVLDRNGVVVGLRRIAQSDAEITDDDVGTVENLQRMIPERDPVAGGSLAGDRQSPNAFDAKLVLQPNRSARVEDDRARAAARLDALAQRAGTMVAEVDDMIDVAAAAPLSKPAIALRRGKRELRLPRTASPVRLRRRLCRDGKHQEKKQERLPKQRGRDCEFHIADFDH